MSPGKLNRTTAAAATLALVAGGAALLSTPASAAPPPGGDLLYGLTDANALVQFRASTPGTLSAPRAITGITGTIEGIDVRPATGELYALGKSSAVGQLYVINPATGVATAQGAAITPALDGTTFGFDFNPAADRVRIVSDTGQNLRINPDTGGASATTTTAGINTNGGTTDGQLAYAAGDPAAGVAPTVKAAGYTNSVAGTTSTALYDIDTARGTLVRQNPANDGTLATIGSLNVAGVSDASLDVAARDNVAYAELRTNVSGFYRVDLGTGAATLAGTFATAVQDVTVATSFLRAGSASVAEGQSATITVTRTGDTSESASVDYAVTNGTGTAGSDAAATTGSLQFAAGESSRVLNVQTTQDDATEGVETLGITLTNPSVGVVGRAGTLTITDDSPAGSAENGTAYGLVQGTSGTTNAITTFDVATPGTIARTQTIIPATGADAFAANLQFVGIDVRPVNGVLYAVASTGPNTTGSLYTINPTTGVATFVRTLPALNGTNFGVDFNPTVDRLRVVSDTGQNLRLNVTDATGATDFTDGSLAYAAGDAGAGKTPRVDAVGYTNSTNNSVATPTATMLFDIDTANDVLAQQVPANDGTLKTIGALGLDVDRVSGLDVAASGNAAFAVLRPAGSTTSALYRIDLTTGAATRIGTALGAGTITDLSLASTAPGTMLPPGVAPSPTPTPTPTPSATATPSAQVGRFHPVTPARIYDSRVPSEGRVVAGTDRRVQVTGQGGIPSSGVSAVVLNVTNALGSERGDLQVFPTGQKPDVRTSNLNYIRGQAVPVQVQLGVGTGGGVSFSVNTGSADVVVDVFGWYGDSTDTSGSGYTALAPQRLLDTRTSGRGSVVANQDRDVQVSGLLGVPANATAVTFNATLLGTPANADLQIYPTGSKPAQRTSNLNVARGQTRANAVTTPLGDDGKVSLSISQNSAAVVLDVQGYYSPSSPGRFIALQPQRIFDTRTTDRPGITSDRPAVIRGKGGVPASATAAVLSVTATGAGASLDLRVFPTGDRPANRTSTLNLQPAEAVANLDVATLGSDGSVTLSVSRSQAQVILDVVGYFTGS